MRTKVIPKVNSLKKMESNKIDLLLDMRENIYSEQTREIVDLFDLRLSNAVKIFLKTNQKINWILVDLLPSLKGFVRVMGSLTAAVEDVNQFFENLNNEIEIKEHPQNYNQFINLVLPIEMLNSGSVDQLVHFINDLSAVILLVDEKEMIKIFNAYHAQKPEKMSDLDIYKKLFRKKRLNENKKSEFSLIDLTENQLDSLYLHDRCMSETKN